jgi:hypothetical protein
MQNVTPITVSISNKKKKNDDFVHWHVSYTFKNTIQDQL